MGDSPDPRWDYLLVLCRHPSTPAYPPKRNCQQLKKAQLLQVGWTVERREKGPWGSSDISSVRTHALQR